MTDRRNSATRFGKGPLALRTPVDYALELFLTKPVRYSSTGQEPDEWIQGTMKNGGVGERLKPAVLKNEIADSLSDRKFY